jgi:hypothetical protein
MSNFMIELKALGRLIKFFGLMLVGLFAAQQFIWLMWAAFGN